MTLKKHGIIAVIVVVAVLFAAVFQIMTASASAPSGLSSTVATTSSLQVGPQQNQTLFTANTICASRIITTTASPIRLTFEAAASTTVSGSIGHLQAASTTAVYDGALYGCGLFRAYAYSSTTITISETQ